MIRHAYRVSLLSSRPNSGRAYLARASPLCGQRPAPAPNGLSLGVPVGCGGARRGVHQFEFLAAAVAAAAAAASAAVRHVSPVPHSPRQYEASYALNLGRPFGRRPVRASSARSRQCFGSFSATPPRCPERKLRAPGGHAEGGVGLLPSPALCRSKPAPARHCPPRSPPT